MAEATRLQRISVFRDQLAEVKSGDPDEIYSRQLMAKGNGNPKTHVQKPNPEHPPRLATFAGIVEVISFPQFLCQ